MIVAVAGHRFLKPNMVHRWEARIRTELLNLPLVPDLVLIGDAPGIDAVAQRACDASELLTMVFSTQWDEHGTSAPTRRNGAMIKTLQGFKEGGIMVAVLVFTQSPGSADGTMNMIRQAKRAGLNPVVIDHVGRKTVVT